MAGGSAEGSESPKDLRHFRVKTEHEFLEVTLNGRDLSPLEETNFDIVNIRRNNVIPGTKVANVLGKL